MIILVNEKTQNSGIEEKTRMIGKLENAVNVIQEFEKIIRSNKKIIVRILCHQGIIFRKFKQREKFTNMISKY